MVSVDLQRGNVTISDERPKHATSQAEAYQNLKDKRSELSERLESLRPQYEHLRTSAGIAREGLQRANRRIKDLEDSLELVREGIKIDSDPGLGQLREEVRRGIGEAIRRAQGGIRVREKNLQELRKLRKELLDKQRTQQQPDKKLDEQVEKTRSSIKRHRAGLADARARLSDKKITGSDVEDGTMIAEVEVPDTLKHLRARRSKLLDRLEDAKIGPVGKSHWTETLAIPERAGKAAKRELDSVERKLEIVVGKIRQHEDADTVRQARALKKAMLRGMIDGIRVRDFQRRESVSVADAPTTSQATGPGTEARTAGTETGQPGVATRPQEPTAPQPRTVTVQSEMPAYLQSYDGPVTAKDLNNWIYREDKRSQFTGLGFGSTIVGRSLLGAKRDFGIDIAMENGLILERNGAENLELFRKIMQFERAKVVETDQELINALNPKTSTPAAMHSADHKVWLNWGGTKQAKQELAELELNGIVPAHHTEKMSLLAQGIVPEYLHAHTKYFIEVTADRLRLRGTSMPLPASREAPARSSAGTSTATENMIRTEQAAAGSDIGTVIYGNAEGAPHEILASDLDEEQRKRRAANATMQREAAQATA